MKKEKKWMLITFGIIVALITILISYTQFYDGESVRNNKESSILIEDAKNILENVAQVSHPVSSKENEAVCNYIIKYFEQLGIDTTTQSQDISSIDSPYKFNPEKEGKLKNIIAVIPGSLNPDNVIVFTAHYDSVAEGPGASDDGYGVVAVLEAAKIISEGKRPSNTIYFILTDGEEEGLLGASSLIENTDIFDNVGLVINFEARGNKGVPILFETNENNYELIKLFKDVVNSPVAYSFGYETYKFLNNNTDYTIYKKHNIQGYNFSIIDGFKDYHESTDSIENINEYTLQQYYLHSSSLIKNLAYISTDELQNILECKQNGVYFTLWKHRLIIYPESFKYILLIILLICFTIIFVQAYKKQFICVEKMLKGLGELLLGIFVVSIASYIIIRLIYLIMHSEVVSLIYILEYELCNYLMVFLIIVVIVVELIRVPKLLKKYGADNIGLSLLLLQILLGISTSLFIGGISYIWVIPSIIKCITLFPRVFNMKYSNVFRYVFVTLWIVPDILLVVPILYLIFLAMTVGISPVIVLMFSIIFDFSIISFYLSKERINKLSLT